MKKILLILLCVPFLAITQNSHTINIVGNTFSPSSLTITVGDDVTWNNTSGTHNVNGTQATYPNNPDDFGNAVAPAPWSFPHIFTIPGTYDYQCDPHVGMGMVGTIVVAPECPIVLVPESTPGACDAYIDLDLVLLAALGCTPPYIYQWNGSPTPQSGYCSGQPYNVFIELIDANNNLCCQYSDPNLVFPMMSLSGCTDSTADNYDPLATVDDGSCIYCSSLSATVTSSDVTCFGGSDGTATVTVTGGTPPYSYLWNGPLQQVSPTVVGYVAGTYSVIVTDSVGCQITTSVTITEPSELIANAIITDVSCPGLCDGSVSLNPTGGCAPYFFYWPNGNVTQIETGLCEGWSSVFTITDCNNCMISEVVGPIGLLGLSGCTDVAACNYDASATCDDGSCLTAYGCMDATACNYDPLATCDDSSCLTEYGCMDMTAMNYDPIATCDDGSCFYCTQNQLSIIVGGGTADNDISWSVVEFGGSWASASGIAGNNIACIADNCYLVNMYDAGGDGWNGATYTITDSLGNVLSTGTLASGNSGHNLFQVGIPCPLPPADNLFFSEYAEGSGSNKYFEIYNPTNDTLDLNNYAYPMVNNSPSNGVGIYEYWRNFDSASVILPNDVFVVAHTDADSSILIQADMIVTGNTSLSNGNDGMALVYGNEPLLPLAPGSDYIVLDWIGTWNGDYINNPGSSNDGWDVAGEPMGTANHTIIRKCPISQGDTSWTNAAGTNSVNSQWIVLGNNDWTNIGVHNTCVCDSSTNSYTFITDTICNGLSITVGNSTYDSTGVYSDTLLAFNGCDSIITTTLTVLNTSVSATIIDLTICDGDSAIIGNTFYYMSGTFTESLTNIAGCDSLVTLNLTVQTPVSWDVSICDGDSIVVGSSVYNSAGSYTDIIQSSIGCDSIVHTNLMIYSQSLISGGIPNNTVGGGSYYSGSQHLELSCYTASELVSAVIYSDDTTLTTFEIRDDNGVVLDSVTANIIPGGYKIYFNYTMSPGANYELGISGSSDGLFRNNAGVNYPYGFANAAALTSSSAGANYYYFFYDIQVNALSTAAFTTNYSFCDGDSILVAGSVYNTTGFYTDSLTSSIGCDSLVYSNVVVSPHVAYINNQTVCSGETYLINGNVYDSTGTYIDSLQTFFGCDSIVTTHLNVDTISGGSGMNNFTICIGDSIVVGSSVYYHNGVYNDTLVASNGCDSILTTYLTVNTANYTAIFGGILDTTIGGGGFFSGSQYLELSCYETSMLASAFVYAQDTTLTVFEIRDDNGNVLSDTTYQLIPGGNRIYFNYEMTAGLDYQLGINGNSDNLYRNNAGVNYSYDFGTAASITSSSAGGNYYYFFYDVEVLPYLYEYNEKYICYGDSIIVGGNTYNTPGQYLDNFVSFGSCDSVVFTVLDFYQSPSLFIQSVPDPAEICLGDSVVLEGSQGFVYYWWDNGLLNDRLVDFPTEDTWYLLSAKDSNDCIVKEDIWVYVDSCITGFEELSSNLNIYPNPSTGLFVVEFREVKENNLTIRIINSIGDVIFFEELKVGDRSKQINISDLSKGIYFVELQTDDGVINKKLILQ